jgi:transcriptional regulator with XRE-family HTH domain
MQTSPVASTRPEQVLGKATARAAEALGLRGKQLAQVVGYSEPTVSRVLTGERGIDPSTKPGELALLLVRVFRSLDALVGGNDRQRLLWMNSHNRALNAIPAELVRTAEGLVRTLAYLDSMRAPS